MKASPGRTTVTRAPRFSRAARIAVLSREASAKTSHVRSGAAARGATGTGIQCGTENQFSMDSRRWSPSAPASKATGIVAARTGSIQCRCFSKA